MQQAWEFCREAADLARSAGDGALLADAATTIRSTQDRLLAAQIHELSVEALASLDPADSTRRERVQAVLTATQSPWARPVQPITQDPDDAESRFRALQARHVELIGAEHVHPLATRARALLDARRPRRAGMLTDREEQVVMLLAGGLSNRAIAQRLQLSERTVENHVSHVLTKMGHTSRSRVAAWYAGLESRQLPRRSPARPHPTPIGSPIGSPMINGSGHLRLRCNMKWPETLINPWPATLINPDPPAPARARPARPRPCQRPETGEPIPIPLGTVCCTEVAAGRDLRTCRFCAARSLLE